MKSTYVKIAIFVLLVGLLTACGSQATRIRPPPHPPRQLRSKLRHRPTLRLSTDTAAPTDTTVATEPAAATNPLHKARPLVLRMMFFPLSKAAVQIAMVGNALRKV